MKFFTQYLLCGFLTSLLFPPFFLFPLGFLIFPYLFYLFINKKFNSFGYIYHFFSGLFYGLGFFSIFLIWIKEPFFLDQETESFFLISYLLIIYCSIFFGIIFLIFDYFKNFFLKLLIFPLLIVLVEYLIGHIGYGFPWISTDHQMARRMS